MGDESAHALDVALSLDPDAKVWRGDLRLEVSNERGPLVSGACFNLVEDANPNDLTVIGQYRVIATVQAPEGYTAVLAISCEAVASQVPSVNMSRVIKSDFIR